MRCIGGKIYVDTDSRGWFLQEARALLGRLEYQRGNVEAALRVFDGIDIAAIAPKMKVSITRKIGRHKPQSPWDVPHMSIHAVSLLIEATYLKAKALQDLGRFKGMSIYKFEKVKQVLLTFISPLDLFAFRHISLD